MKSTLAVASCILLGSALFAAEKTEKMAKPMTDQEFVDFAAQTDMTEAHLGQMAQEKGDAQAVKDYGQMLTSDHTNDYNTITSVATKANLTVPKGIDAAHDRMIAPMDKMKGAAFDHMFLRDMVSGHDHAISVYKKEANDAQNADLKSYATQALPVLEKHLNAAQDLIKNKTK